MAIFKKSEPVQTPPRTAPPATEAKRPTRSKNVSVIGSTLVIKGELSADEDLIIEGRVEGTIAHHHKHLTVGAHGRVKADIHASSVIVLGKLVGDIHSEGMVSIAKGADVSGNIYCGNIVMEHGARFKGNIDMTDAASASASALPKEPAKAAAIETGRPNKIAGEKPASVQADRPAKVAADKPATVAGEKSDKVAGHTAKSSVY